MSENLTSRPPLGTSDESSLTKIYEPASVESRWYSIWENAGYFSPLPDGKAYTIVIPPPNVTGSLHMGHALNSTLQDILIRYKRMTGMAALWVPGTDHGGIATQNVVEKILLKEGTDRHKLGREKFLERMWAWRNEAGDAILNQLRRLGASLDWSRYRFTMDEVCSKAVRKAFVELYNRKLLYRGNRLVNWCPRCRTALADIEVEHEDKNGYLWRIRYPIIDRPVSSRPPAKKGKLSSLADSEPSFIVVATTRPETLLGDTAVAVNPKDKRYKNLVGAKIKVPLTDRVVPLISDAIVDQTFGSGAVKVTPAHDPVDFEIAGRAGLPHISVIGFDGKMTEAAGPGYAKLDRFEARKKIVEDLESQGLLEKIEDYKLSITTCYRCGEIIEPLESEQWFLKVSDMAKKAREANKRGKVKILPKSWESPYQLWLRNIKDWCVSRQIWWGHRIPVWTCATTTCPPVVSLEDPTTCPVCKGTNLTQDPDVLDTWFSSALWPVSVFSWPDQTTDLKKFFPTSTLVTGHEILYLWVARMVMFALEFEGKVPFNTVFIHGIVRDKKGRKMSKSLGNVIDPLDIIKQFGVDAMRFSLAHMATPGRDMQISNDNFLAMRNFSNKIWNATRFSLMHIQDMKSIPPLDQVSASMELADRWILHRFNDVVDQTSKALDQFELDAAARGLYDFFWGDFCDWYLEMVKPRFEVESPSKEAAKAVLATVLEGTLRMLHPFMPFITEEVWEKIPKPTSVKTKHLMVSLWPETSAVYKNKDAFEKMGFIQEVVTKLRNLRSEMGIPPSQKIELRVHSSDMDLVKLLKDQEQILQSLNSRVEKLILDPHGERPQASATAVVPGANLYVPLQGLIDFSKERARLQKEADLLVQDVERLSKKLSNQDFITHAPQEEVDKVKARLEESQERLNRLNENISTLAE